MRPVFSELYGWVTTTHHVGTPTRRIMAETAAHTPRSDDPFNEAVATTGLFLIITAIIAIVVALASWGADEPLIAAVSGCAALVGFAASIMCFKAESIERTPSDVAA